jgi:hypothetical protein
MLQFEWEQIRINKEIFGKKIRHRVLVLYTL